MDESGGRYVHVIADGGLWHPGDIAKAFSVGADAAGIRVDARARDRGTGRRMALGTEASTSEFPRGNRVEVRTGCNRSNRSAHPQLRMVQ
jgi:IMP dehydrogenase